MNELRRFVVAGAVLMILIGAGLAVMAATASAEKIEDPHIHGISEREGSILRIAVDDQSKTAYRSISWYVYTPSNVHVSHLVDGSGEDPFIQDLAPGYYVFTFEYEVGPQLIVWHIADTVYEFSLRITDRQILDDPDRPDNMIRVDPGYLTQQEREVAAGSFLAFMIPSFFIMSFWKSRKQEGWENAFE